MPDRKICASCGNVCLPIGSTTGYGISPNGQIHCFDCCADLDRLSMRTTGRVTLYLTDTNPIERQHEYLSHVLRNARFSVGNWPGSLAFVPTSVRKGKHNIAGSRIDVWFPFEGFYWHGVNIGDNQILRCKRTRKPAP